MTTRRLNYTGCQRIRRLDVQISVDETTRPAKFAWVHDLDAYEFPSDAEVVIEAYAHWTVMRFDCGRISGPAVTSESVLSDFDSAQGVRFRLKVVGTGDQAGLILGEADQISPAEIDGKAEGQSFLPVQPAELGDVLWQLSFATGQPLLRINERVGDWRSFLRRQEVRALLLPELFRQLLREAVGNEAEMGDEASWQQAVISSVPASVGPRPVAGNQDALAMWVDEAVQKFAHRHRLLSGIAHWDIAE